MLCNCKSSVRLPCANSVLCWPCAVAELVWSFLPNTPQFPSCLLFLRLCVPVPHSSPKLPSFQPFVKFSFPHFPNQTLHPKLTVCTVFRILYTPPTLFVFLHTNSILWESINPVMTLSFFGILHAPQMLQVQNLCFCANSFLVQMDTHCQWPALRFWKAKDKAYKDPDSRH